ncbi:MAG TPA: ADP-forming succinate--CoA ligase subunit beta [Acidobacteriota bacterium]|nr:ADP-forming succinate--CoA ligase subunit beta [Acidobacteriota bacterium]
MKIHEYQAKRILKQFNVQVPDGRVVQTPAEAYEAARKLGLPVAVKAQIHAGGRGKGGGIKVVQTPEEAENEARRMLGARLVTPQTGPEGRQVRRLLIEKGQAIKKEYYLGIVIDRSQEKPVIMASSEGGVEIEEVAARNPDLILKMHVDPCVGLLPFQARQLAYGLGIEPGLVGRFSQFVEGLYQAFQATDASLAEINPLILTADGDFLALDAKMNFDDNALFRHPELQELRDFEEEEPLEIQASRYGLNYIKLDGNVGCMVNGAGLAMATMDIIKLWGGNPANFLDVGGGANVDQVRNAFKILVADPNVKAVLINIFGGIMRCDVVASGVVQAIRDVGLNVPVVVRLEGTNVEAGREVLRESGLNFHIAGSMSDAAQKVCQLTTENK